MALQLIFGMTISPVAKCLLFASKMIIKVLEQGHVSKFSMPSSEMLKENREMIQ